MSHKTKAVTLFFMATVLSCGAAMKKTSLTDITPVPLKVERTDGTFTIKPNTTMSADKNALKSAKQLAAMLRTATGYPIPVTTDKRKTSNTISLAMVSTNTIPWHEGYILKVSDKSVRISASSDAGLFYGFQTLLNLLPPQIYAKLLQSGVNWSIPAMTISDHPRFAWRGMHLDPSRHFIPFNDLLQLVDIAAMHKINILHLHLTDNEGWRLPISGYPKLTAIGSRGKRGSIGKGKPLFYTKSQIKQLIAYANARHITVVPEIDVPGHCGAVYRSYPELCLDNKTLDITKKEARDFVSAVFAEVATIFPGQWIHFGGDEVNTRTWNKSASIQKAMKNKGLKSTAGLLHSFYRDVADIIVANGKTPVGWDEIANANVNKKSVIMWWRATSPQSLRSAINGGYKAVLVPNNPLYLNFSEVDYERGAPWRAGTNSKKEIYALDPIPKAAKALSQQILGVQCCLWGEFMDSTKTLQYMALPRLALVAELGWSFPQQRNFEDALRRLETAKQRYAAMGVNYRKGYTLQKIGVQQSKDGKIAVSLIDVTDICKTPGTYLLRIRTNAKNKAPRWAKAELLADGSIIATANSPTVSGSPRKWPRFLRDYILTVKSIPENHTNVLVRLPAVRGNGNFTFFMAKIQPEGFGPIDW